MSMSKILWVVCFGFCFVAQVFAEKPQVIPALQSWTDASGTYTLPQQPRIVVARQDARKGTPMLVVRMQTFARDLKLATGRSIKFAVAERPNPGDIFVRLRATDAALGKEGYELSVSPKGIQILAHTPQGAFWATRTLLQVFAQQNNAFPCGVAKDFPLYPLRGFMYDVGRKPCRIEQLYAVMKTMSYYKMNDLQLHLNDNFIWLHNYLDKNTPDGRNATPEQKKAACAQVLAATPTPCGFRLESSMVGTNGVRLTSSDYYYTKEEFGKLIDDARLYGVNIVPELDVPGHAMSFVRVRPDLMYRGSLSKGNDTERVAMLDASSDLYPGKKTTYRDETLAFVKKVFDEYLLPQAGGKPPVFRDAVVHIGTDEYYGNAEDYRAFADDLLKHVKSRGFTPRLWGSLTRKAGKTPVVSDGVEMHIWSRDWQRPQPAIDAGYKIINILDADMYMVPNGTGNVGAYQDLLPLKSFYETWQPHIMRQYKVEPRHPQLLGAAFAVWNDNSWCRAPGLTDGDLFDRIRDTSAVLAEKTWNNGTAIPFDAFQKLSAAIDVPKGLNPRHVLDKVLKGDVVALSSETENKATGFEQVAVIPDYTVTFDVKRTNASTREQVLFSSWTGAFKAVQANGGGKVGYSCDTMDYVFDYTLPVGRWVTLSLVATGRSLVLFADGVRVGTPERLVFASSNKYNTFYFPLETYGDRNGKASFIGGIRNFTLTPVVPRALDDVLDARAFVITATSEQPGSEIARVLDGNTSTLWHSKYNPTQPPPYTLEINLPEPRDIDGISFLPRQDGNDNGTPQAATLYVQEAGTWKKVADYSGSGSERKRCSISFPRVRTKAVRFVITQGKNGFGALSEMYIHRAK